MSTDLIGKNRNRTRAFALMLLLLSAPTLRGCAPASPGASPAARIANEEAVIHAIRKGLKEHSRAIHVTFPCDGTLEKNAGVLAEEWMARAMAETDDPAEGDYIRFQTGGYQADARRIDAADGTARLELTITPSYYLYLAQEEEAQIALDDVLAAISPAAGASEEARIRAAYDYVCENVSYDTVHQSNPYYTLRSTMYSALVHHTATCQGYAVTLYRLLREMGIECRVVTGTGVRSVTTARKETALREEYHAWNIVRLDGQWYGLDATWDAGCEEYRYFMAPIDDFPGHVPAVSVSEGSDGAL